MNIEQLQALILDVVAEVAPEADLGIIDPDVSFHEQFEIDSVDYLNIMMTLEARLRLSIPEADYPNLSFLNGPVHYLQPKLAKKARKLRQARLKPFSIPRHSWWCGFPRREAFAPGGNSCTLQAVQFY